MSSIEDKQTSGQFTIASVLAQTLDIQARLQLTLGQAEQALTNWQKSASEFEKAGDRAGELRSKINSVQALRALGLYSRAFKTLTELKQTLSSTPDSLTKVVGWRSLGEVQQLVGDLNSSRQVLQQSLQLAQRLQLPSEIGATLLSLGNTASAQQDTLAALKFYQQAASLSPSPSTKIQAQLNQLSLLIETQQWSQAQALQSQIQSQITSLPASRTAVYARINLAENLMKLGNRGLGREQGEESRGSRGAEGQRGSCARNIFSNPKRLHLKHSPSPLPPIESAPHPPSPHYH